MLKISFQNAADAVVFELTGRLAGPWVRELELSWRSATGTHPVRSVRVDLSSVTFIDKEGKNLLEKMVREGAELAACGCLNRCIVEEIIRSLENKA